VVIPTIITTIIFSLQWLVGVGGTVLPRVFCRIFWGRTAAQAKAEKTKEEEEEEDRALLRKSSMRC